MQLEKLRQAKKACTHPWHVSVISNNLPPHRQPIQGLSQYLTPCPSAAVDGKQSIPVASLFPTPLCQGWAGGGKDKCHGTAQVRQPWSLHHHRVPLRWEHWCTVPKYTWESGLCCQYDVIPCMQNRCNRTFQTFASDDHKWITYYLPNKFLSLARHLRTTSKQPPHWLLFWASLCCTLLGDPTSLLPSSYCTFRSQPLCATSTVWSCICLHLTTAP